MTTVTFPTVEAALSAISEKVLGAPCVIRKPCWEAFTFPEPPPRKCGCGFQTVCDICQKSGHGFDIELGEVELTEGGRYRLLEEGEKLEPHDQYYWHEKKRWDVVFGYAGYDRPFAKAFWGSVVRRLVIEPSKEPRPEGFVSLEPELTFTPAFRSELEMGYVPAPPETENHPPTPCCGYVCGTEHPHPVMWNPYNGVVQCHNCGETYTPGTQLPDIRGYWSKDGKFHEGMPPAGEPNPHWTTPMPTAAEVVAKLENDMAENWLRNRAFREAVEPDPTEGGRYRILEPEATLASGDQFKPSDSGWRDSYEVGGKVGDYVGRYRRPVAQEPDHTEGGKYRMLEKGEIVRDGDEWFHPKENKWYPVERGAGYFYNPDNWRSHVRRPI